MSFCTRHAAEVMQVIDKDVVAATQAGWRKYLAGTGTGAGSRAGDAVSVPTGGPDSPAAASCAWGSLAPT